MRGEREKNIAVLMARYGIGRRLATRVVALLSHRVDVTDTLLAGAGDDETLEGLLLEPQWLTTPESLTEDSLRSRAGELGVRESDLLRVLVDPAEGWRTVALEDDLLAQVAPEDRPPVPEDLSLVRAGPTEISARETQDLFTPAEVARLKLSVLTSQDLDERVESLRKLVFAPLEGAQKAGIFVSVLTDREADLKVRREAIRSLQQIGFRSDMADAVRGLFTEDTEDAVYAIQRLGALLGEAEQGEVALTLAVVLEVLDQSQDARIVRELLQLVARSAALLVTDHQKTERFLQCALRQLTREFDRLKPAVEDALGACSAQAPDLMVDLFWAEVQRADSARVRSFLLSLTESVALGSEMADELARRAVDEILNPALPEGEKARLRYALVRVGEPAALIVLERVDGASGVQRSELIRLLDVLCTESEVSDGVVERSVLALLDLLKLADRVTRRNIVEAAVLADPRVPAQVRVQLAHELLNLMAELHLAGTLDAIQTSLEKIGPPALGPAYAFMRREYPSEAAERAALVLGRVIQSSPEALTPALAEQVFGLCTDLLAEPSLKDGAFTMPMAAVCGYTPFGERVFDDTLRSLRESLWRLPYSMDVLDALAVMAGSPNVRRNHQDALFQLFDGIVRFQARTGLGVRRDGEEGSVYEFGREVQFDTQAVPAAVRGLERICVSPVASTEMRVEIVKRLLILWEGVSKVRVVWGPGAIDALVGAMCDVASSPHSTTAMKVRLGVSLRRFLYKIRVIEGLGTVCSQEDTAPEMHVLAVGTCVQLLQEWESADEQDHERKLVLLRAVGRIAANPSLDAGDGRVERLRERVLQALFSGLREGLAGVREPLILLRDCPGTPPARRREIDERLSKAFGLVRLGH